ncbi:MAG: hypothetical protein WCQ77_12000, partial [Planctomycetota bacterium]
CLIHAANVHSEPESNPSIDWLVSLHFRAGCPRFRGDDDLPHFSNDSPQSKFFRINLEEKAPPDGISGREMT